ncbi:MAG: SDR family NAD(P)-dependent oxidoreductase [Actinomycetota bacterium]
MAVVTGAASGLGRGIAHRLARAGCAVVIADVDVAAAERVAGEIAADGGWAEARSLDVADLDQVRATATDVQRTHGGLDCLVNNAGFDIPGFFLETDPATWDGLIAVNLTGVINCTHALAPLIARRARVTGYGRIVNVASDAGRVGALGEAVYSAAKGGVIAFSKTMARELARDGITVNAVCPGPADTPMTDAIRATELGEKLMQLLIAATPLRRLATPDDVAGAVAYFASDEARFVTAQVLSVSGGLTIPG